MADSLDEKIRNRNSWLRTFVIGIFSIVGGGWLSIVGWKLLHVKIALDLAGFGLSDLVSVLLAFFAIWLSVAFYHRATEASNTFYDNTYKFTKDTSEILGRIEAGFGERLRHLDEGYTGLRESMLRLPVERSEVQTNLKHEEAEIRRIEQQRDELLQQLSERANLQDAEKQKFLNTISSQDRELQLARTEAAALRRQLATDSGAATSKRPSTGGPEDRVTIYLRQQSTRDLFGDLNNKSDSLRERFAEIKEVLPGGFIRDLELLGFIDRDSRLTDTGISSISRLLKLPLTPPTDSV